MTTRYTTQRVSPGYYAVRDGENPGRIIIFAGRHGICAMASKAEAAAAAKALNARAPAEA